MTEIDEQSFANARAAYQKLGMNFGAGMPQIVIDPTEDPGMFENRDYVVVCETCGVLLNSFTHPDGQTWVHARNWQKFDHEPTPKQVPKTQHVAQLCDFCGHEDEPLIWTFTTSERIKAQTGNTTHDYGKTWGSCPQCAPFILDNDLNGLVERSMRVSPVAKKFGVDGLPTLRASLYQMLGPVLHLLESKKWVGPKREPAKLDPRMLPKVHTGLIKFWSNPRLYDRIPGKVWKSHSVPGTHAGHDDQFRVNYPSEHAMPPQVWTEHTEHIVRNLRSSTHELFWVSADFTILAAMAAQDFEKFTIAREDLPSPSGLIIWEKPIGVIERPDGEAGICAISWCPVPGGIWVSTYIQGEDADPLIDVTTMRADWGYLMSPNSGAGFPFDYDMGEVPDNLDPRTERFIFTLFSTWFLLNQPGVAEVSTAPVDKKIERAYRRARTPLPTVKLVNLRRQPSRSHHQGAEDTAERRRFRYRRYTKGHWKRQFYGPKRGLRKMIYISPYISGDANLPLKDKLPVVKVLR